METSIEIREFYIGNFQTEFRAFRGNELLMKDTNKTSLIRRIAKRFGENVLHASSNQVKSGERK